MLNFLSEKMNRDTRTFILGIALFIYGIKEARSYYDEGLEGFWSWFWFIGCIYVAIAGLEKIIKTTD